jgi:hypothetical protein
MLGAARADIFAARAITLSCAQAIDMARATGEAGWSARGAFLTPIAKAFGTDAGIAAADAAIQVFGGMGYVEETGVAQYWRDARITAIYEGTNGVQAADLVGRKMADGGDAAFRLLDEVEATAETARTAHPGLSRDLWGAAESLREATEWLVDQPMADRLAGSSAYLAAFARVLGGRHHLAAAMAEGGSGPRAALARLYVSRLLPRTAAHIAEARAGAEGLMAISPEDLAA